MNQKYLYKVEVYISCINQFETLTYASLSEAKKVFNYLTSKNCWECKQPKCNRFELQKCKIFSLHSWNVVSSWVSNGVVVKGYNDYWIKKI